MITISINLYLMNKLTTQTSYIILNIIQNIYILRYRRLLYYLIAEEETDNIFDENLICCHVLKK